MRRSPEIEMGYPLNGWFIVEHPIKMDDMGVPPYHRFRRPPYDIAIQIWEGICNGVSHWCASQTKPSNTGSSKKVLLLERSAVANLYTRKWGTCWNSNLEAHLDEKDLPTSDRHWENPYFPGVVFLYEPKTDARVVCWTCQVFHLNTRLRCS